MKKKLQLFTIEYRIALFVNYHKCHIPGRLKLDSLYAASCDEKMQLKITTHSPTSHQRTLPSSLLTQIAHLR